MIYHNLKAELKSIINIIKNILKYILLLFIFIACDNIKVTDNKVNNNEIFFKIQKEVKFLMLNNLPNEYSLFGNDIIDELNNSLKIDSSFDAISHGFLFKFFKFPKNNTCFSIIKSPLKKYYYWDNSELFKYDSLLDYKNENMFLYLNKFDTLPVITESNDRECKLLLFFFNDILLQIDNKLNDKQKIDIFIHLLNTLYFQAQNSSNTCKYSILDYTKDVPSDEMIDILIPSFNDDSYRKKIYARDFINKLMNKQSSNSTSCLFRIEGVGVFAFVIKLENNKVMIEKYFIPDPKRKLYMVV